MAQVKLSECLNPCFNGSWSVRKSRNLTIDALDTKCLNPCFNGSRSVSKRGGGASGVKLQKS